MVSATGAFNGPGLRVERKVMLMFWSIPVWYKPSLLGPDHRDILLPSKLNAYRRAAVSSNLKRMVFPIRERRFPFSHCSSSSVTSALTAELSARLYPLSSSTLTVMLPPLASALTRSDPDRFSSGCVTILPRPRRCSGSIPAKPSGRRYARQRNPSRQFEW